MTKENQDQSLFKEEVYKQLAITPEEIKAKRLANKKREKTRRKREITKVVKSILKDKKLFEAVKKGKYKLTLFNERYDDDPGGDGWPSIDYWVKLTLDSEGMKCLDGLSWGYTKPVIGNVKLNPEDIPTIYWPTGKYREDETNLTEYLVEENELIKVTGKEILSNLEEEVQRLVK